MKHEYVIFYKKYISEWESEKEILEKDGYAYDPQEMVYVAANDICPNLDFDEVDKECLKSEYNGKPLSCDLFIEDSLLNKYIKGVNEKIVDKTKYIEIEKLWALSSSIFYKWSTLKTMAFAAPKDDFWIPVSKRYCAGFKPIKLQIKGVDGSNITIINESFMSVFEKWFYEQIKYGMDNMSYVQELPSTEFFDKSSIAYEFVMYHMYFFYSWLGCSKSKIANRLHAKLKVLTCHIAYMFGLFDSTHADTENFRHLKKSQSIHLYLHPYKTSSGMYRVETVSIEPNYNNKFTNLSCAKETWKQYVEERRQKEISEFFKILHSIK